MAILNKEQGCVVLRIVYAGAPLSGKTESLRALSELLFGEAQNTRVYSPDQTDGRTLYFDWLNYTGGYFRGYKVNCQLISVPGQKTLQSRRKLLVEMADVVVFVVDSEFDKLEGAVNYYQEMQPWLQRDDEPPIGVILQANKRDVINAVAMPNLYTAFGDKSNLLAIETIATKNSGIREAFVTSVRLGLERASWLLDNGKMAIGIPELSSGDGLLDFIQLQEHAKLQQLSNYTDSQAAPEPLHTAPEPVDLRPQQLQQLINEELKANAQQKVTLSNNPTPKPAAQWIDATAEAALRYRPSETLIIPDHKSPPTKEIAAKSSVTTTESPETISTTENKTTPELSSPTPDYPLLPAPNLPHKDVIAGSVFPPISGRIILHKLAESEVNLQQTGENTWEAKVSDQWSLRSNSEDCFSNTNDARMHLVRYANQHKKIGSFLSEHRCMAIVESDQQHEWRIWQIIRNEITLEHLLINALMDFSPQRIAEQTYNIAEKLIEADQFISQHQLNLPLRLNTIGLHQEQVIFTDYIPHHSLDVTPLTITELLKTNLKPLINKALKKNSTLTVGAPFILHSLDKHSKSKSKNTVILEVLRTLFIGEQ